MPKVAFRSSPRNTGVKSSRKGKRKKEKGRGECCFPLFFLPSSFFLIGGTHVDSTRGRGRIEVICGSMFSGKSEELIRRVKRAEIARQKVQVFKPVLDNRFGKDQVSSHSGAHMNALPVQSAAEVMQIVNAETDVVAIDEVQFFDWAIADVANALADRGKRVILAGLDLDFRGEPFGPMPLLMAQAEELEKLHAIC